METGYDAFISVLIVYADFAYGGVVAGIIFVCILSHCDIVAGNKNLLR